MLPPTNRAAPFNITRASHLVLTSRDLAKARDFYTDVVGLKVSHETATTIHFRGAEERCHHSLTLRATKGPPECECIGFRVLDEEDLEKASAHFEASGIKVRFVNVPFQGRTLRLADSAGTPIEFCARMKTLKRSCERTHEQKGAGAQRLNHFEALTTDVAAASSFYCEVGFRVSEYSCVGARIVDALLHRKGDPHDLVLREGPEPALHHVAYVVQETHHLLHAVDAASHLKLGAAVELGPVRHGYSYRLYLRDPDGHRLALLLPPIQVIDHDDDGRVRRDVEHVDTWGIGSVLQRHATPFAQATGAPSLPSRALPKGAGLREEGSRYVAHKGTLSLARRPGVSEPTL
jgi:catechol 2,3-dioxygenase